MAQTEITLTPWQQCVREHVVGAHAGDRIRLVNVMPRGKRPLRRGLTTALLMSLLDVSWSHVVMFCVTQTAASACADAFLLMLRDRGLHCVQHKRDLVLYKDADRATLRRVEFVTAEKYTDTSRRNVLYVADANLFMFAREGAIYDALALATAGSAFLVAITIPAAVGVVVDGSQLASSNSDWTVITLDTPRAIPQM